MSKAAASIQAALDLLEEFVVGVGEDLDALLGLEEKMTAMASILATVFSIRSRKALRLSDVLDRLTHLGGELEDASSAAEGIGAYHQRLLLRQLAPQ